jgi:hypothetical protein
MVELIFPQQGHEFGSRGDFPNFDIFVLPGTGQH